MIHGEMNLTVAGEVRLSAKINNINKETNDGSKKKDTVFVYYRKYAFCNM